MKYTLVWMPRGKLTFYKNIEYLALEWNETVIKQFLERVDTVLKAISDNPYIYPFYKKSNFVRRSILNERVILFYRIATKNRVEILLFWNTHQDTGKLRYGK